MNTSSNRQTDASRKKRVVARPSVICNSRNPFCILGRHKHMQLQAMLKRKNANRRCNRRIVLQKGLAIPLAILFRNRICLCGESCSEDWHILWREDSCPAVRIGKSSCHRRVLTHRKLAILCAILLPSYNADCQSLLLDPSRPATGFGNPTCKSA